MNRPLALLLALCPALASMPARAQAPGPAIESCAALARADANRNSPAVAGVTLERDRALHLERFGRKLGAQPVGAILSGHGALVLKESPPIEMSFVCLLADDKRALFFHWAPRRDAPALAQCRRSKAAAACLDTLLEVAERDLMDAYAGHFAEARAIDAISKNENAAAAFRRSSDAWRAYRDAECARRGGGEESKACLIDLTRRRALDLQ